MNEIKLKRLREDAIMPERVTNGSAAYDAIIPCDYKLNYGRQIIPLGWASAMGIDLALNCRTRAGYAAKGLVCYIEDPERDIEMKIRIDAEVCLGLVDSDYRDEVGIILNVTDPVVCYNEIYLHRGQALAQWEFVHVPETILVEVTDLDETERTGGFGKMNNE